MTKVRLPPQPTDTALARFVQRVVDVMPWIMARHLRVARKTVDRQSGQINALIHEAYQLRRDYRNLFDGCRAAYPVIANAKVGVWDDEPSMVRTLSLRSNYQPMQMNIGISGIEARLFGISEIGADALRQAATALAREYVPTHRDHLIQMALHGKTIEEVLKK